MTFVAFLPRVQLQTEDRSGVWRRCKGQYADELRGYSPGPHTVCSRRNPAKQGKYMPGSRIPIAAEARLSEVRPDYVVDSPLESPGRR